MRVRMHHVARVLTAAGLVLAGVGLFSPPATAEQTECPDGTVLVAKFEWVDDQYVFEKPEGNEDVVMILDDPAPTADGASWTSTVPIAAVVVKGGSGEQSESVTLYDPPVTSGTFSNEGLLNKGGQVPEISEVLFCGPAGEETTTTTTAPEETTTTTTAPEETTTTTTAPGETTTTGATVLGVTVTRPPSAPAGPAATTGAPTEVLGVQIARTGLSDRLLVAGFGLVAVGLLFELAAAMQRRSAAAET